MNLESGFHRKFFLILTGVVIAISAALTVRFLWAFNTVNVENASLLDKISKYINYGEIPPGLLPIDKEYEMPEKEQTRFDLLFLGIRGDDPENPEAGNLLADSIMVFSYDSLTKKAALISIPRDLYIKIPKTGKKEKINTAYVLGLEKRRPISFAKELVSRVTGIYIDKVVVADFKAFEDLIKAVGGIEIYLNKPFVEGQQWGYEFSLPQGLNTLNSEQTLYYVRSRFSSSDFDRTRRQQEVIFALKSKLASIGLLKDPIKLNSVIKILEKNVKTDIGPLDIPKMINLSNSVSNLKISRYLISPENLVYESHKNGAYILLTKNDSLEEIKKLFNDIIK